MTPIEALNSDLMRWTKEVEQIALDALREIDKLLLTLGDANRHFVAEGEMNAALHLSETVLPNPLAAKVGGTLRDGQIAAERLQKRLRGEKELPFNESSD